MGGAASMKNGVRCGEAKARRGGKDRMANCQRTRRLELRAGGERLVVVVLEVEEVGNQLSDSLS